MWRKEHRANGADSAAYAAPADNADHDGHEPQPAKKLNPLLIRKMEQRRGELEEEIAQSEAEIAAHELEMAHFKNAEESIRLAKLIEDRRALLKDMMKEWEQLGLALEET